MSAIDDLNALQSSLAGRAGAFDPGLLDLQGMFGSASGAFQNAINNQNTATGLSPEALSALRTQGTSGINDQYQSAAQAVNSNLLRRGAAGGGELPGSGGDISRAYQPLYSAMEAAKTKANTDTILADEAAKQKSLYQNQQMALGAANNVFGNANTLFNSGNAALGGAANIANAAGELEGPDYWKMLLASLGTSALTGGVGGRGGGGGLVSGTGLNDTGKFGVLGDVLGKVGGLFGIGGAAPAGEGTIAEGIGTPNMLGKLGTTAASTVSGAAIPGVGGSAAMGLLTNPVTAVAAAAAIGAVAWVKSQAHWEANTWTQGFQKPFDDKMQQAQNGLFRAIDSGQVSRQQATQVRDQAQEALQGYLQKLDTFYREKGTNSDQSRVAAQAYQTFQQNYGPGGQGYLAQLDQKISQLPG